jgi:hypothetical protein
MALAFGVKPLRFLRIIRRFGKLCSCHLQSKFSQRSTWLNPESRSQTLNSSCENVRARPYRLIKKASRKSHTLKVIRSWVWKARIGNKIYWRNFLLPSASGLWLMMKLTNTSVTSFNFFQTERRIIPEENHLVTCRCENLKSRVM